MKTITLHCHAKNSGANYSQSIRIDGQTREQIEKRKAEIFEAAENALGSYFYDVECWDDLTQEEKTMLEELELEVDF